MKKVIISADLKAGTEIVVCDYSKLAHDGEAMVEVHFYYEPLKKYDIFYYPESWTNAKEALNGQPELWLSKVVYHVPADDAASNNSAII